MRGVRGIELLCMLWHCGYMITIDDKQIKEFERDLKVFASRAYPFATKSTVNSAAFLTQKTARRDINVKMVTRNRFTIQSVRVEQARTLNVSRQVAIVGSTADYMADQEFGGVNVKTGGEGVAIPTGYSAGQERQQPRTRLPRKPNKLSNIQLKRRRGKAVGRKQRNVQAIKAAARSSNKYVYLDLGNRKGIFKVIGGERRPRLKMVYDLSRVSTPIPKNPWLKPATNDTRHKIPAIYLKALQFQAKRHNLFK